MKPHVLVLMVLLGFGCGPKGKNQVAILPAQQMTRVLWDILQVDEFAVSNLANDSSRDINKARIGLYQQVFDLHHISQKDFSASFKYYSGHPDLMKTMFDSLSARGDRERKNVYMHVDSPKIKVIPPR
jgi:hypothetical protein